MSGTGVAMADGRVVDLEITGRRFKEDPYPVFARLRADAPVCRVRRTRQVSHLAGHALR